MPTHSALKYGYATRFSPSLVALTIMFDGVIEVRSFIRFRSDCALLH